jgi:hypothetical protein
VASGTTGVAPAAPHSRSDPQWKPKLRTLRQLLAALPPSEIAVLQDEVDINTNSKIGAMWMRRGNQAEILTPGTNEKRCLGRARLTG